MSDLRATMAELRGLLEKATSGRWDTHWGGTIGRPPMLHILRAGTVTMPGGDRSADNARLAAAAVNALPSLLAAVEEKDAEIERLQRAFDHMDECHTDALRMWMDRGKEIAALTAERDEWRQKFITEEWPRLNEMRERKAKMHERAQRAEVRAETAERERDEARDAYHANANKNADAILKADDHLTRAGAPLGPTLFSRIDGLGTRAESAEERVRELEAAAAPVLARLDAITADGDECGGEYGCECGYVHAMMEVDVLRALLSKGGSDAQ